MHILTFPGFKRLPYGFRYKISNKKSQIVKFKSKFVYLYFICMHHKKIIPPLLSKI